METLNKIPTGKIQRASKLLKTGAKVGVNYLKYYGEKLTKTEEEAKENLDKSNAADIYDSLKELKGSALKVAQMLSMEKSIMPQAYVEKFSLSQFSVPPLSGPLVVKTFKRHFGQSPQQLFDTFNLQSVNAASIGQVHKATKDGKELAVKIQYPGVADSISSDLALVKPIAMKMFNIKGKDSDQYFQEVETKLLEETNYVLELQQSQEVAQLCSHLPNLKFPSYYEALSTEQILTMDWMQGWPLGQFAKQNTDASVANKVGQALWDFYMYQIHVLRKVHADPHPGNFLVSDSHELIAIDFGCMKTIPPSFYQPYFELTSDAILQDPVKLEQKLLELEIYKPDDTPDEHKFFGKLFAELLTLFTLPLRAEWFDFSDKDFFQRIADLGQQYAKDTQLRNLNANRGSKHFIYMNRTFFGLYNLMHELQASNVEINRFKKYEAKAAEMEVS